MMTNAGPVTLKIASGGTISEKLSDKLSAGQLKIVRAGMRGLVVTAPAALTGTVTVQGVNDEGDTTAHALQTTPGTDVTIPAAKTVSVLASGLADLWFISGSSEGADRLFSVLIAVDA